MKRRRKIKKAQAGKIIQSVGIGKNTSRTNVHTPLGTRSVIKEKNRTLSDQIEDNKGKIRTTEREDTIAWNSPYRISSGNLPFAPKRKLKKR